MCMYQPCHSSSFITFLLFPFAELSSSKCVKFLHGLINYYLDIKSKCRHLKKLTFKETLRQVFIISEFIHQRYSQSCWYFRCSFVNCCPSSPLSGSTLPPPSFSFSCMNTVCIPVLVLCTRYPYTEGDKINRIVIA